MKIISNLFLRVEEKTRAYFQRFPFMHAFLAGVGVVLFWRGVWHSADEVFLSSGWSMVLGSFILIIVGVFAQTFVGNMIIIKNVEGEKRLEQKTKADVKKVGEEVQVEKVSLELLAKKLESIEAKLEQLKK